MLDGRIRQWLCSFLKQLILLCELDTVLRWQMDNEENKMLFKQVKGYVCIDIRLQESYFSLRVTFIQSYLVKTRRTLVKRAPKKLVYRLTERH